ncbi:MAG TPA: divalent metal cation transporter [Ktedonobacteraceae bacterium]|nr:divalent metal cation transporter [Ktedonobacteraceae bacterium]
MAKNQQQEGPEGQKPDLNEIQPGVKVEDTDHDLGDSDLSKPRVSKVIRNKQGQVEDIVVNKGVIFKKQVEVPAGRVEKVEPDGKKGEVVIETVAEDEQELAKRGLDKLPDEQKGDLISEAQRAMPTAEGLAAQEAENEQEEDQQNQQFQSAEEQQKKPEKRKNLLSRLIHDIGPGFLAGMSGNDATAVTSYAIDGATVGYGHLWLMVLTTPMYQAVEYTCSKIGRVTKMGLDEILAAHYSRWVAVLASLVLIIANVGLIAGNLVAIGSGFELITGISWVWFVIPAAVGLWYITVFSNFNLVEKIFIVMSAAFIAYIVTALFSGADWKMVLIRSFVPQINFNFADISAALALLGATLSPYSMYWQARAETEEKRKGPMKQQFREDGIDVASGTLGGNLVSYFIIITTASTLFVHHQSINTAADAANALGPLVGPFAKYLFAIGLIGAGLIAIPVMSASTAYAVAGTFGWPAALSDKPWQAEGFYIVLSVALLISIVLAMLRIDPIKLIFYANVLTGILAPIMVIYLIFIGNSRKIMGKYRISWLTNFFLGLTALVLIAGSVIFFYGLATGQGGQ